MLTTLLVVTVIAPVWKTDQVEIVLHRSAGMVYPENTVPAIEEAVRQGADGIEIDVRKTLDGHLVLYHDDWLVDTLGPGALIEDLTLAEARKLDIGSRWGSEFAGLKVPLLKDVLSFANSNNLLIFFDIKTKNIDQDIKKVVRETNSQSIVVLPERLATRKPVPWIDHWGYLEGGEESLERMKEVIQKVESPPKRIIADDARALVAALGRDVNQRPFVPYKESKMPASTELPANIRSKNIRQLRRGLWAQAQHPVEENWPLVRALAQTAANPSIRLDAITALGSSPHTDDVILLTKIGNEKQATDPANDPTGKPYFDTYRTTAVALSLAKIGTPQAQESLKDLAKQKGFGPTAVSMAVVAVSQDPKLLSLIQPDKNSLTFAVSYAGGHPHGEQVYAKCLEQDALVRRHAVFGLARLAKKNRTKIERLLQSSSDKVKSGAKLALEWADK